MNESTSCLDFIANHGGHLKPVDKQGVTPIIMAAISGRSKNIKYLYDHDKALSSSEDFGDFGDKFGLAGINLPQKSSHCPIHFSVSEGHFEATQTLLELGAQVDKPLNSNCDKLTPLMLAG